MKTSQNELNDPQRPKMINKEVHNDPKQVPLSKERRVKLILLSHCFFIAGAKDDLYDLFITKKTSKIIKTRSGARRRLRGMLNGKGKLSSVSAANVCGRDGDVLLRTNTLETSHDDELHKREFATQHRLSMKVAHSRLWAPGME